MYNDKEIRDWFLSSVGREYYLLSALKDSVRDWMKYLDCTDAEAEYRKFSDLSRWLEKEIEQRDPPQLRKIE